MASMLKKTFTRPMAVLYCIQCFLHACCFAIGTNYLQSRHKDVINLCALRFVCGKWNADAWILQVPVKWASKNGYLSLPRTSHNNLHKKSVVTACNAAEEEYRAMYLQPDTDSSRIHDALCHTHHCLSWAVAAAVTSSQLSFYSLER